MDAVNVQSIFYSRAAVLDSWITSDGRAYIAQLQEIDPAAISHSDLGTLDGEGEQVRFKPTFKNPLRSRRFA